MNIKKFLVGVSAGALLLASTAMPALAAGKAAPKTTGGVGYTAYGLQRNAEFNAIETTTNCLISDWNLDGNWALGFNSTLYPSGNPYAHSVTITGATATGSSTGNTYTATVSVVGNSVTIVATYLVGSAAFPYSYTANGTISGAGTLSGTWTGTDGDSGTWSSTSGTAVQTVTGCTGKGMFKYSDVNGNFYTVDVQYVNVSGNEAWFAGPVVSGNVGAGNWLFAKVLDGGEPSVGVDQIWGSFTTEAAAKVGVASMSNPGDGFFTITSGNLQVH